MPELMRDILYARMRMEHRDGDGVVAGPPPPRTQSERITRLEEEVHSMREVLQDQREVLDSMARDFSKFVTWTVTSLSRMIDKAGVTYMRYSESLVEYQKCNVRRRTNGAGTFAAPQ
nr:hypothetical protein [Tanacetum cinerariifolium]